MGERPKVQIVYADDDDSTPSFDYLPHEVLFIIRCVTRRTQYHGKKKKKNKEMEDVPDFFVHQSIQPIRNCVLEMLKQQKFRIQQTERVKRNIVFDQVYYDFNVIFD